LHLRNVALLALLFAMGCARPVTHGPYGIGSSADPRAIAASDLAVGPDGDGLPPGSGTPSRGSVVFAAACSRCHGAAVRLDPERWPYATTLFDYIRRAMPPDRTKPLPPSDLYALTAFLLYANQNVRADDVMDTTTLPRVTMPNIKDFIDKH